MINSQPSVVSHHSTC